MCKLAEDNQEDDEGWDPAIEFVVVDDFVAEEGDKEGAGGNDDDTCVPRDIIVDSMQELGANNDIDRGPPDTG